MVTYTKAENDLYKHTKADSDLYYDFLNIKFNKPNYKKKKY